MTGFSDAPAAASLPAAASAASRPELSIVIAMYNEQEAVAPLLDKLSGVLGELGLTYEIILVDDGSRDETLVRAKAALAGVEGLRIVELYRNYGQVAAIGAGLTFARGAWIVMMDGDLQHDPADIKRLVAERERGHDMVATFRVNREETRLRLAITWIGNRVNRYLLGVPIRDLGSAYRLFSARLLDMMTDVRGFTHYNTPALYVHARSFAELPITQARRPYGRSKWNLIAFIMYNMDFFTHSKKITQLLLNLGALGIVIGAILYIINLLSLFASARAASAPISLAFTSFLIILLAIIWRQVIQNQQHALGFPPFLLAGIWRVSARGAPELEPPSGPIAQATSRQLHPASG